jgi:rhodanese-related sulfurtransferase
MARKHQKSIPTSSKPASHSRHKGRKRKLTWLWISLAVLLFAIAGFLALRPKAAPSVEITPAQAYAKFHQGAFILDVRSQEEWDQFHITGSTLIPLDKLENRLSELPTDQDFVVVCLSGHRSQSGVTILQEAGFKHIFCLSGGLQAWIAGGYPVESKAP